MNRRSFLKVGAGATVVGATGPGNATPRREEAMAEANTVPGVLVSYSAEEQRRRLENIAWCNQTIHGCMRKHLVTTYLPGQCVYNLGEYPARKPWDPDEWDERELDALRDHGIGLIQVHEEWNDSQRLFGGHKFESCNPAGFRRFVEMVHKRGMKIICYISTGFFERTDPDFREEWARRQDLVEIYFRYARCSPAGPAWRAYLLPHLVRILDQYGVDGFYNDLGYIPLAGNPRPPTQDEVLAFEEGPTHSGALEDLLALIYAEVKRRGGLVKIHASAANHPQTDLRVYDYLWVGESVKNGDGLREAVKDFPPYVVPCLDMSRATIDNEDELYLHAIPYMQFPLLLAGRPFTGERALVPGIEYPPEERCFWTRHCRAIWKHYQEHPEGPHSYGWWDSVPGRPEARPTHRRWLARYRPMVEEGTWAYLEVHDSDLFAGPAPEHVVASLFANCDVYLVLANYAHAPVSVTTAEAYKPAAEPAAAPETRWELDGRSLLILRRAA